MTDRLTPKQEAFCREYAIDKNATQAAIRAGYSKKTARAAGARLLAHVNISKKVGDVAKVHAVKLEITAERVLEEIAAMALYDVSDLVEISKGGRITSLKHPRDIKKLPANVRKAVKGWKWDKAGRFIVMLADRSKALDQLARHLSLYNDKLEVTGVDALAERLERAHRNANAG